MGAVHPSVTLYKSAAPAPSPLICWQQAHFLSSQTTLFALVPCCICCACVPCSNPNLQNVPTKTGGIVRTVGGGEVDSILDSLNIRSWFTPSRGEG